MGLLDALQSPEAQFGLGLLSAAGPSAVPMSFGQRLGGAMQQFQAAKIAEEERRQKAAMQALQAQLINAQIGETQAQAKQREAAVQEAQRKAVEAARIQQEQAQFLANPFKQQAVGGSFMAGSGERTPTENAQAQSGSSRQVFDYATAARVFGPEHAAKLMEGLNNSRNFGLDEVARTADSAQGNRPGTIQLDKFGRPVGQFIPKAVEMKLADLGGTKRAYNPYGLAEGQKFDVTVDPNTVYTGNITMRGQNMTDARARDANGIAANNKIGDAETSLRKEFEGLPEVKSYKQAFPSYSAILDASKRSTPMADINLVYGLAKMYDPNSVVREGEYATVANSPNIPERVKGWAQYLQGGGKLTPEVKAQIVAEATGRIKSYEAEVGKARTSYSQIAARGGLNPDNIFPVMGNVGENKPSGLPKPGAVEGGYRFKGGNPSDPNSWEKL